jgi:hypothetical protein
MTDVVAETRYTKAMEGQKAEYALEVLQRHLEEAREQVFDELIKAGTPDEAWQVKVKFDAISEFVAGCEAAVYVGKDANLNIIEGME